jgi:hypothetical protein
MIPTLGLRPLAGVAALIAVGTIAQAIENPAGPASLFALRAMHWSLTAAALGYPLVFAGRYDLVFVGLWVAVLATWAVCDNACVLSLVELAHPAATDAAEMRLLPWPWPAFVVLLLVVALRTPAVRRCPDKIMLFGALATYVAVHRRIYTSQTHRVVHRPLYTAHGPPGPVALTGIPSTRTSM